MKKILFLYNFIQRLSLKIHQKIVLNINFYDFEIHEIPKVLYFIITYIILKLTHRMNKNFLKMCKIFEKQS